MTSEWPSLTIDGVDGLHIAITDHECCEGICLSFTVDDLPTLIEGKTFSVGLGTWEAFTLIAKMAEALRERWLREPRAQ